MSDRICCRRIANVNVISANVMIYIMERDCSFSFVTSLPFGRPRATSYHRSTRVSHDWNVKLALVSCAVLQCDHGGSGRRVIGVMAK